MAINTKSIRTKFLLLLTLTAVVITGVSMIYDLVAGGAAIRDQIVKRGRYVASNLAFNAKYGVLTEDKPLLTQFLEGAVAPGGERERSDVVGAMIRDAKGAILAQTGKAIRDLPGALPAALEERSQGRPALRPNKRLSLRIYADAAYERLLPPLRCNARSRSRPRPPAGPASARPASRSASQSRTATCVYASSAGRAASG